MYEGKSILIVDDNEPLLRHLKKIIRAFGIKDIRTVSNGMDAINQCKTNPPDLMLLDIHMPVVDGWEVLHELKGMKARTKVIVFSIRNDAESGLEAARLGATDYLAKADILEKAEIKIKRALDRGTPVTQDTTATLIRNNVDELAREINSAPNIDQNVIERITELAKLAESTNIDKKRTFSVLQLLEDALRHTPAHVAAVGLIRGLEKLLSLL